MKSPKKEGPSAQEQELQRVSAAQWNDYVARYRPAEAELIRRAELTPGERASAKGQANADAAGAFKGLTRSTVAANQGRVQSGGTKLALAGDALSTGRARGLAGAAAETGAEQDRDAQQLGIAATGRGIAQAATADLARGARRQTSLNLAASQARFERNQARTEALAAVAGAATRKYQKYKQDKLDQAELVPIDMNSLPIHRGGVRVDNEFDPYLTRGLA